MSYTHFELVIRLPAGAIAAGRKLSVDQFDVTSAFTQAEIDAEIYVEPPKGFATTGTWTIYFVLLQTRLLFSGFTGIS